MSIKIELPDECGGTRLSAFISLALLQRGPLWLRFHPVNSRN